MDDRMLDAIYERLKPAVCTQGTFLVREGDPGHLDSLSTNWGRTSFFNSYCIRLGDFYGEELLTRALDPCPGVIVPSSIPTIQAISNVEAFALRAEDLILWHPNSRGSIASNSGTSSGFFHTNGEHGLLALYR
ncbi:Putative cyclic nucleotide-gated ion channel 15 [Ancistrocladus abbreviatus]